MTVTTFIYKEIVCKFGPPKVIQSDQDTHFINQMIDQLVEKFRIKHSVSSVYYLQSNRLVERFNRILCKEIVKVVDIVLDWDILVQPILFTYRIKKLHITNAISYKLIYGKEI